MRYCDGGKPYLTQIPCSEKYRPEIKRLRIALIPEKERKEFLAKITPKPSNDKEQEGGDKSTDASPIEKHSSSAYKTKPDEDEKDDGPVNVDGFPQSIRDLLGKLKSPRKNKSKLAPRKHRIYKQRKPYGPRKLKNPTILPDSPNSVMDTPGTHQHLPKAEPISGNITEEVLDELALLAGPARGMSRCDWGHILDNASKQLLMCIEETEKRNPTFSTSAFSTKVLWLVPKKSRALFRRLRNLYNGGDCFSPGTSSVKFTDAEKKRELPEDATAPPQSKKMRPDPVISSSSADSIASNSSTPSLVQDEDSCSDRSALMGSWTSGNVFQELAELLMHVSKTNPTAEQLERDYCIKKQLNDEKEEVMCSDFFM